MSRAKPTTLARRTVAVRAVVAALVNEALSGGAPVDARQIARLGLLPFDGAADQPHDPLLSPAELERFVRALAAEWASSR